MKEIIDSLHEIVKVASYRKQIQLDIVSHSPKYSDGNFIHYKAVNNLQRCGCYQVWKIFYSGGRKMVEGHFCDQPKICPICAKLLTLQRCVKVLKWINERCSKGYLYNLTLTTKDKEDLFDARHDLNKLKEGMKDLRKYYLSNRLSYVPEFIKFLGYFLKEEIKRGENSHLWHPHYHGIAHSESMINYDEFRKQLNDIKGENCSNKIQLMKSDDLKGILEATKYSLKFSKDVSGINDIWEVYSRTKRQKMFHRFGTFRNLNEDEKIIINDSDKDYWILLLNYVHNEFKGKSMTKEEYEVTNEQE